MKNFDLILQEETCPLQREGTVAYTWKWDETPPLLEWQAQGLTIEVAENNSEWN